MKTGNRMVVEIWVIGVTAVFVISGIVVSCQTKRGVAQESPVKIEAPKPCVVVSQDVYKCTFDHDVCYGFNGGGISCKFGAAQ